MVNFTLEAEDPDGEIESWELDPDDGSDVILGDGDPPGTIVHTFALTGTYHVSFIVVDDEGKEDVDTVMVTVEEGAGENRPPTSSLAANVKRGGVPFEATFDLNASDPDGAIFSWELDVDGDGSAEYDGSGTPPSTLSHTYEDNGTNLAILTVEDGRGAVSYSTTVVVSGTAGHSRDWPAHLNDTVAYREDDHYLYGDHVVNATVRMVIRGEDAWAIIEEANMFNDPPHEGSEYILALIDFGFESSSVDDVQYDVSSWDFTSVSSPGVDQEISFVLDPEPILSGELYAGASLQGWASYEVPIGDPAPLLAFGRDFDGLGGMWFELFESDENERPFAAIGLDDGSGGTPVQTTAFLGGMDLDGTIASWELDLNGDDVPEYQGNGTPAVSYTHLRAHET